MQFILQSAAPFNFINELLNKFKNAGSLISVKKRTVLLGENLEIVSTPINSKNETALLKEYADGLKEMMFITHHKVRQPVANILNMAEMIDEHECTSEELKKIVGYMKQSAADLDSFTRELSTLMDKLEQKEKT